MAGMASIAFVRNSDRHPDDLGKGYGAWQGQVEGMAMEPSYVDEPSLSVTPAMIDG
jgi:hypothetical protein